jgi:hypothetical protein
MLLDTNIVSYFYRRDTRAALYEQYLIGQPRYIAFATLGELYKWPLERNWGSERLRTFICATMWCCPTTMRWPALGHSGGVGETARAHPRICRFMDRRNGPAP